MKTIGRILALSLFLAGSAKADVPPPDMEACRGKPLGTACTYLGTAGTCANSTCSKLDYANWNRDASASPPFTTYACVLCKAGPSTGTTTNTTTTTTTNTDPPEKKEDSGCQMGDVSVRRVAPWMLAGSFSLLFLFARRRRTR